MMLYDVKAVFYFRNREPFEVLLNEHPYSSREDAQVNAVGYNNGISAAWSREEKLTYNNFNGDCFTIDMSDVTFVTVKAALQVMN